MIAITSSDNRTQSAIEKDKSQKAAGSLKDWSIYEVENVSSEGTANAQLWKCPLKTCYFVFEELAGLTSHLLQNHTLHPNACSSSKSATTNKLIDHFQVHQTEKQFKCLYENCKKGFNTKANLKTHTKLVHNPGIKFPCDFNNCCAVFHNQKSLDLHRATHEEAVPEYTCTISTCGKAFFTSNALTTHMKSHERKAGGLKCTICGKEFDAHCRLKVHMLSHESSKPFRCQELDCTLSFVSQSKLKRHMQTHLSNRKFECSHLGCSKAFKRKEHLVEHEVRLHYEKKKTRKKTHLSSIAVSEDKPLSEVLPALVTSSPFPSKNSDSDESIENNPCLSSPTHQSSTHSQCFGSARTSLSYGDFMQRKCTTKAKKCLNEKRMQESKIKFKNALHINSGLESIHSDNSPPVEQDLMLSSTNLPDSSSLTLQEELLCQDYFLLDPSNRLSDFEPSTINLRDLE